MSGGQRVFIKEATMTTTNIIQADADHEQNGRMFPRINQFVDTCTVDASVTKYARAKRTRRSGRYFYEPRVSGGAQSQQGLTLSWDSPRK